MAERQKFTSRFSTVLTMIGVAVGLGNVWRFPYMMGSNGGSAFLFVFLFFVVFFAIPAVMAEWALGRETRSGPLGAFSAAFGPNVGRVIGFILSITVLIANSYYLIVIGYIAYSTYISMKTGFSPDANAAMGAALGEGSIQYPITLAILGVSLLVIHLGLNRGIARASQIFVPYFGIVVGYIIWHTLRIDGAMDALAEFLKPDFSKMGGNEVFAAMGQAFFSLSLGGTFFVIYGSYLKDDENIPTAAVLTGLGDAGTALLASLFIIPAMLVFQLDPASGPDLIFAALPELFSQMPAGRLIGTLFFIALGLVAFLSNIAALEVLIGGLGDFFKYSKTKILVAIGILEAILILPTAFNPSLIGKLDMIFGSFMQCVGSALALLAVTWGLGRAKTLQQVFGRTEGRLPAFYFFWVRWVVPAGLLIVLGITIYDNIKG